MAAARDAELAALRRYKIYEAFSGPVNVTIPVITSVCRGTWGRVTVDQFRLGASNLLKHRASTNT